VLATALPLLLVALTAPGAEVAPIDPRTVVLLREECSSSIAHRELVLFANGTVRLREGAPGREKMTLGEVAGEALRAYRNRLAEVVRDDVEIQSEGPAGEWIERCRLALEPDEASSFSISYGRLDAGSLALEGLRRIVEDLVEVARNAGNSAEIPSSYVPQVGDRLVRADGAIFEIVSFTSDGKAIELRSDEPPITMYVERSGLRAEFVRRAPAETPP